MRPLNRNTDGVHGERSLRTRQARQGASKLLALPWVVVLGLLLAAALGAPVASWAAALMMPLVALACLAFMCSAQDLAQALLKPIGVLLFIALLAAPAGSVVRGLLQTPEVQRGIGLGIGILMIVGVLYLAARMLAAKPPPKKPVAPKVRMRMQVIDPEDAPPVLSGKPTSERASRASPPAEDTDDVVSLFRRRRRP